MKTTNENTITSISNQDEKEIMKNPMVERQAKRNRNMAGGFISLASAVALAMGSAGDAEAQSVTADFNNDGYQDVVFGDWRRFIDGKSRAGAVTVMYTGPSGLYEGIQTQNLTQSDDSNRFDHPEKNDYFGYSVAVGDFNGDNFDDLAVSAPFDEENSNRNISGSVSIFYGTTAGLTATGVFATKLQPRSANNTRFGYALAAADFDQDGMDDLAVGQTGEVNGSAIGAVEIFYGNERHLGASVKLIPGVNIGGRQPGSRFGSALAAGDIDCNGHPDLLIGAPGFRNARGQTNAGLAVAVFHSATGRTAFSTKTITDYNEADNTNDEFGSAVAIGNFNQGVCAEVAIAHRGEKVGNKKGAGAVTVIDGDPNGMLNKRTLWYQGRAHFTERAESYDRFGSALVVADFNQDGRDDLAIGVPGEDYEATWPDRNNVGKVHVLYGNSTGLRFHNGPYDGSNYRVGTFAQGVGGVQGAREQFDQFGYALSAGDYNNDGTQDLLVGVPYENVADSVGVIQVIHGTTSGLKPIPGIHQYFHVGNLRGVSGTHQITGLSLP